MRNEGEKTRLKEGKAGKEPKDGEFEGSEEGDIKAGISPEEGEKEKESRTEV